MRPFSYALQLSSEHHLDQMGSRLVERLPDGSGQLLARVHGHRRHPHGLRHFDPVQVRVVDVKHGRKVGPIAGMPARATSIFKMP